MEIFFYFSKFLTFSLLPSSSLFSLPSSSFSRFDETENFLNLNVLVVGAGASGTDLAHLISRHARHVYVADRNFLQKQEEEAEKVEEEEEQEKEKVESGGGEKRKKRKKKNRIMIEKDSRMIRQSPIEWCPGLSSYLPAEEEENDEDDEDDEEEKEYKR